MKWKRIGWGKKRIDVLQGRLFTAYVYYSKGEDAIRYYNTFDRMSKVAPNREYAKMWAKKRLLELDSLLTLF